MIVGTGHRLWLTGSVEPRYDVLAISEHRYIDVTASFGAWTSIGSHFYASGGPGVNADVDWYPTRLPVSIGTRLYAYTDLRHEQGPGYWSFQYPENPTWVPGYNNNSWSVRTEAGLGPAFGRLRDATPVLQALLVGEALADEKLLTVPMSEDALQTLAKTLAGGNPFYYSHDAGRDVKFYYAEIERVLQSTGCIAGRLPARAWLRLREIVGQQPLLEDRYWRTGIKLSVRGGVTAGASQSVYNHGGRREVYKAANAGFSELATLTFGHPFTTRLHLTGRAEVRDEPHYSNDDRLHYATAAASLSYLLPDRVLVSADGQCQYTRADRSATPARTEESRSASVGVDLQLYVEDRSTLTAGVSYGVTSGQSGASAPWQGYCGLSFSISLRRYF